MKKRLMIGLMAGGLLAAMLPGVAHAAPDQNPNSPTFEVIATCQTTPSGGQTGFRATGAAGWAQAIVMDAFNSRQRDQCLPGTFEFTITKIS